MIKHLLTTLFLLTVGMSSLSAKRPYTIDTGAFSKLKVSDNISVIYKCLPDSAGKAVFTCEDQFADAFLFTNPKNEVLTVQVSPDFIDRIDRLPVIYVYSQFLTEVETSSNKRVEIHSPAAQASFKGILIGNGTLDMENVVADRVNVALASGNGTLIISGKAVDATLGLAGTGCIDALQLEAKNITCRTIGTGNIKCWFTDKLVQHGLSSTTIYYKGNPKNVKKKGLAKLKHLSE